jgi:hypothetical protein
MASAQLTTLVDTIVNTINNAPSGTWSDLTIGTGPGAFTKARPALDPENLFESDNVGLYVVPVTMLYNRDASRGRGQIIQLNRGPVIALCLTYRFESVDTSGLDVSTWTGVTKLLNLREEIDLLVLNQSYDWNIAGITAEPAQEIPLKARWFLSVTEIEFSGMTC